MRLPLAPVPLGSVIPHTIESLRPIAEAKQVRLQYRSAAGRDECAADRKLKMKSFNVVKRGEDIYVVTD